MGNFRRNSPMNAPRNFPYNDSKNYQINFTRNSTRIFPVSLSRNFVSKSLRYFLKHFSGNSSWEFQRNRREIPCAIPQEISQGIHQFLLKKKNTNLKNRHLRNLFKKFLGELVQLVREHLKRAWKRSSEKMLMESLKKYFAKFSEEIWQNPRKTVWKIVVKFSRNLAKPTKNCMKNCGKIHFLGKLMKNFKEIPLKFLYNLFRNLCATVWEILLSIRKASWLKSSKNHWFRIKMEIMLTSFHRQALSTA